MYEFKNIDYWNAIILYGLNNATYKLALGEVLLQFTEEGISKIDWPLLSQSFLKTYITRLSKADPMPQQVNPARMTVVERVVARMQVGLLTHDEAVEEIGRNAFNDVIPRFHSIGQDKNFIKDRFYEAEFGKKLILKNDLFDLSGEDLDVLRNELNTRWSLLEGAFAIRRTKSQLLNDERLIYLGNGYTRTDLSSMVPFLSSYQGRRCFYCGEEMQAGSIHVDHVLPRQVVCHDEVWNLVLAHGFCNESKQDRLVPLYYLNKLDARNENIMGSNHPWKQKIEQSIGATSSERSSFLKRQYENVKAVLGNYYWGGSDNYIPESDPFYKILITRLNNG